MTESLMDQRERDYSLDDPLEDGGGVLRDYVATGLITRDQVEIAGGKITYEATFERPNANPGMARSYTVRLSEAAYRELGDLGVP